MPINFAALRGEVSLTNVPDDGNHQARLEGMRLVDTQNGERLVSDWSDAQDEFLTWTTWNRFDATGMADTRELLMALGIDTSTLADGDALEEALVPVIGHVYNVHTQSNKGSRGDMWFTTTKVDGRAQHVQTAMSVDYGEMPHPDPPPATPEDEDDIPF
jgi:hypothetical protein